MKFLIYVKTIILSLIIAKTAFAERPVCLQGELHIFIGVPTTPDYHLTNGAALSKNEYQGLYTLLRSDTSDANDQMFYLPKMNLDFGLDAPPELKLAICSLGIFPSIEIPNHYYDNPKIPNNRPKKWQRGYNM